MAGKRQNGRHSYCYRKGQGALPNKKGLPVAVCPTFQQSLTHLQHMCGCTILKKRG